MVAKDFAHADGVDLDSWEAALTGASDWDIEFRQQNRALNLWSRVLPKAYSMAVPFHAGSLVGYAL